MKKFFLTALIIFLLFPLFAQAICEGPIVPCGREGTPPCTLCHIFEVLNNVLSFILTCLSPLALVLMIVLGGFLFIVSGVEAAMLAQAKSVIRGAVVGFIIISLSFVFLNTFLTFVGLADWVGVDSGGWQITCTLPLPSDDGDDDTNGDDDGGNPSEYCDTCMRTATADGSCSVAMDTDWGELVSNDTYKQDCQDNGFGCCSGDRDKCDSGTCITCNGDFFPDNCGGCSGQGELACWYADSYTDFNTGGESCNTVCQSHGATCVPGNWNDTEGSPIMNYYFGFMDCVNPYGCDGLSSSGDAPFTRDTRGLISGGHADFRRSGGTQDCASSGLPYDYRICVCREEKF